MRLPRRVALLPDTPSPGIAIDDVVAEQPVAAGELHAGIPGIGLIVDGRSCDRATAEPAVILDAVMRVVVHNDVGDGHPGIDLDAVGPVAVALQIFDEPVVDEVETLAAIGVIEAAVDGDQPAAGLRVEPGARIVMHIEVVRGGGDCAGGEGDAGGVVVDLVAVEQQVAHGVGIRRLNEQADILVVVDDGVRDCDARRARLDQDALVGAR